MTLTPDQLTAIDRHLRKENWLLNENLITELTDHYANGLSEQLAQGAGFDAAIRDIHRDFGGRKGLLKMEEDYQTSQTKQTARLMVQSVRNYFQLPRVGVTGLILITVYSIIQFSADKLRVDWTDSWLFFSLLALTVILYLVALIGLISNYRRSGKDKARHQRFATLFQVINAFLMVGFNTRFWFPVDDVSIKYPLPSSVVVTLFIVFELTAIEILFTSLRTNKPLKTA